MEPGEPLHGLDRRRFEPEGVRGGEGRREAAARGGLHVRRGLHVRAQARHSDVVDCHRRNGPDVDPGAPPLAAQRAALRRAAGPEQGGDDEDPRRGTGEDLAAQLRDTAARAHTR